MTEWIPVSWREPNPAQLYDVWAVSDTSGAEQRVTDAQWDVSQQMWLAANNRFIGTAGFLEAYKVTHFTARPRGPNTPTKEQD